MKKHILAIIVVLFTFSAIDSYAKSYVIRGVLDLKGGKFEIPENTTLRFKKNGMIINGEIVGNKTHVKASKKRLFENVTISGSWVIKKVYSDWLDFSCDENCDNLHNFKNLMALCDEQIRQIVYISRGSYWTSTSSQGEALLIPSNTRVINDASIYEIPNSFEHCSLVRISKAENVSLIGGFYYGDVENHKGTTGEWSHGIQCEGSRNVVIKDVVCNDFWGDGIDIVEAYDDKRKPTLICYNINVDNATCLYNRRQGISIEAVFGCEVINCNFSYTGTKKYTRPADGIDIEAWNTFGEKLKDITIRNCTMEGNRGKSISIFANGPWLKDYELYRNNILIESCSMNDIFATCSYGIEYKKCTMDSRMHQYVTELTYTNCVVNGEKVSDRVTNRWE